MKSYNETLLQIINWTMENPEEFERYYNSDMDYYIQEQTDLIAAELHSIANNLTVAA